jgi:hypothetical protein
MLHAFVYQSISLFWQYYHIHIALSLQNDIQIVSVAVSGTEGSYFLDLSDQKFLS